MTTPAPGSPKVDVKISDTVLAAILRFCAAFLALGAAVAAVVWIPDPMIKVLAAGLAGAAILAIEEIIKTNAGV